MSKDYCKDCQKRETCNDCGVEFCNGCKDIYKCGIMEYCDEGHPMQCDNGYEVKSLFDDETEDLDDEVIG